MDKLMPCPFCGGKAHLEENEGDFLIACNQCQSAIIPPGEEPGATATEQEAINAWNRRASGWISVEDKMPASGESVWVSCEIRRIYGGKDYYACEAFYADKYTVVEPNGYDYNADYSEENDEYYLVPGWYEVVHNADDYSCIPIEDFVTYWMPLPDPPEEGNHERP